MRRILIPIVSVALLYGSYAIANPIGGSPIGPAHGIVNSSSVIILDNVAGPTAAQCYGTWDIVNEAITVTLPTAVAGMNICIRDTGSAHDVIVDVQSGDDISLLGAEDTNGDGITNASGASTGDYVCVISATNGHWLVTHSRGTWAQQ